MNIFEMCTETCGRDQRKYPSRSVSAVFTWGMLWYIYCCVS